MNALTPEQEAVAKGFERLSKISEHLPELIQLLRDVADVGHQITYIDIDGEVEAECEPDCTGCRAVELIEKLGLERPKDGECSCCGKVHPNSDCPPA